MQRLYCITFLLLALAFAVVAISVWLSAPVVSVAFCYTGFSLLLLSIAYAGVGPRLLLKRADGRRYLLGWLLFGPYLLLSSVTFWLYRHTSRTPAWAEVAPNLFFGRRLTAREARHTNWTSILDLACEFAEVRPLRQCSRYLSLPVLDATAPTGEQLQVAVTWIHEALQTGTVYVHCAMGHGRSATVILAYLLSVGAAESIKDGLSCIRLLRPGVQLHRQQLQLLRSFGPAGKA